MKRPRKKTTAFLCCALLITALLLSALLLAEHAGHDCTGQHCTICALLDRAGSLLRQAAPLASGFILLQAGLLTACGLVHRRSAPWVFFTPVTLNVRMDA